MMKVYGGDKVELEAKKERSHFQLKQLGAYEIAVKRPNIFGIIPSGLAFKLTAKHSGEDILVKKALNIFSQRKDMSGSRIVPIAEFEIKELEEFELVNLEAAKFKDNDTLIITPKTGIEGFILIFALVLSGIATIAGLVLSILSFTNKL